MTTEERAMTTEDAGAGPAPRDRPGALRWLWYALGGGLPARHRAWVLHDTTTKTWALRHLGRAFVQMAVPIALVLLVVPGPFWIRGMTALGGVALGLIFSLAYMPESTENRVVKAGYPAGTATTTREHNSRIREQRDSERRRAAAARRAARYRERQGR
jgi:hypothetical protein